MSDDAPLPDRYMRINAAPGDLIYVDTLMEPNVYWLSNPRPGMLDHLSYPAKRGIAAQLRAIAELIDRDAEGRLEEPRLVMPPPHGKIGEVR
jgi:hypothetical protein